MDKQALIRLLGSGNAPAITVFGDFCLDKYLYIDAARDELSVETDLVAYQVTHQKMYAGAGGTITNNLRALPWTMWISPLPLGISSGCWAKTAQANPP